MRLPLCSHIYFIVRRWFLNPGLFQIEDMSTLTPPIFRHCLNVKSRKTLDVQCPLYATHGDYCSRHYKNPKPFHGPPTRIESRTYTRADTAAIRAIQRFWRGITPLRRFTLQGPARNSFSIAKNETELYSLDPVAAIPSHYFISFVDERKSVWAFDIRTIVHTMATGFPSHNPYTREPFLERAKRQIHDRIAWLRARKYPILHVNADTLTEEQCWNHRVLDIFLKIEALGYYVSCEWYHSLSLEDHTKFYRKLYSLWEWRLGLSRQEKETIIPGHQSDLLFRFHPDDGIVKSLHWWQKHNMALIEAFITRAQEKEQQKLGAMYVLMALVYVSPRAANALPWLIE